MKICKQFLLILVILICNSQYAMQKDTLSVRDFNQIKDTIVYVEKLDELRAHVFKRTGTISIEQLEKVIEHGKTLKANGGLGLAYRIQGILLYRNAAYRKSVESFESAILYFKKHNYRNSLAMVYSEIYSVESARGNLKKGLSFLLDGIKATKPKDSATFSRLYNNLGALHLTLGDRKSSAEAFLKALVYGKNKVNSALSFANLCNVYIQDKEYQKAKKSVQQAILVSKKFKDYRSLGISYFMFAELYLALDEHTLSRLYTDSVFGAPKPEKLKYVFRRTNELLGKIEMAEGNYKKAQKQFDKAYGYFKKANSKRDLIRNYEQFASLDSLKGNLAGTLGWLQKAQKISDQRMFENSAKKIKTIKADYEAELDKLQIIREQEKQDVQSRTSLFKLRILNFITIAGLLAMIIALISFIKVKKERKKLISNLRKSNNIKIKLFSVISSDLKSEINSLDETLHLLKVNQDSPELFKEVLPLMVQKTNQTSILLKNLLHWSKAQMNELSANPIEFDMTDLINSKIRFLEHKATEKKIQVVNNLELSTLIYADKEMMGIITQNLIDNAIKFCKPGDSIELMSREKGDCYEIGVVDTGIGIASENINKLFAEETFTTKGTQNESGTGLGLRICKELVELNKGNIKVESKPGEGSTFYISLPKAA